MASCTTRHWQMDKTLNVWPGCMSREHMAQEGLGLQTPAPILFRSHTTLPEPSKHSKQRDKD
jgi:hypothetical protein